jgi:RHS repeat-associated protein
LVQSEGYCPFGLTFDGYQRENGVNQNYKYNAKEEQNDVDLGIYDFQRRQYDPAIGRFTTTDPAADLMRRHSPYKFRIR